MEYKFFWKSKIFSNWGYSKFGYMGETFENSEQAFMWEKARYFADFKTADLILKTPDPKEAKAYGRKVKGFNELEWAKVREQFMYDVCRAKFLQNPAMLKELMKYENYVEASKYDRVWGIGIEVGDLNIIDTSKWGQNLLGKVLDKLRSDLS